jgi:hypothetical protein
MADKRFLRSSITIGYQHTAVLPTASAGLLVEVDLGSGFQTIYTFNKNISPLPTNTAAYFETSEVLRDYLTIAFNGTATSQALETRLTFKMYDAYNSTGTVVNTTVYDFYGVDGYSYYAQGANVIVTGTPSAISNREIFLPQNTTGKIPTFSATGFTYNNVTATQQTKTIGTDVYKINRICEPKYNPYKITFVNKFGALQELWLGLLRRDKVAVKSETFKRNIITPTGGYDINQHNQATFNVTGNDSITLNTTFLPEEYNEVLEQLLLSEQIWILENGLTLPIVINTKALDKKTVTNDNLIQYTLDFKYANNKINSIR